MVRERGSSQRGGAHGGQHELAIGRFRVPPLLHLHEPVLGMMEKYKEGNDHQDSPLVEALDCWI
jgi:hypothetical protein